MRNWFLVIAALTVAGGAYANTECSKLPDAVKRLECYDRAFPPSKAEVASQPGKEAVNEAVSWYMGLKLRGETVGTDLGKEPAVLSLTSTNGVDSSLVKAALVWEPEVDIPVLSFFGWRPTLQAGINRNTLSSKQVDTKSASLGGRGTILRADRTPGQLAFDSTLLLRFSEDDKQQTLTRGIRWDNTMTAKWLQYGAPVDPWSIFLRPKMGLYWDDLAKVKTGEIPRETYGGSIALEADVYPTMLSNRWIVSASAKRMHDFGASNNQPRRGETINVIGLRYLLYNRDAKEPPVRPEIRLQRRIGGDYLRDLPDAGETTLSLTLMIN